MVWQFPLRMAGGDVRGVLQYVPQFRGRVFAVLFDEGLLPEPAVAETLLDLKALQEIGVQLVIGVLGGELDDLATVDNHDISRVEDEDVGVGDHGAAVDHPIARQGTFNICMDEPVDYGELGIYLNESQGLPTVEIETPYHSTWLDNSKAKFLLGWRPEYDLKKMTDCAWAFERGPEDLRKVWYPG